MWVGIVTVHMAAVLAAPFLYFLMQTGVETAPWPCRGSISGTVGSFHSKEAFAGQESPDHCKLTHEWCGQAYEPH